MKTTALFLALIAFVHVGPSHKVSMRLAFAQTAGGAVAVERDMGPEVVLDRASSDIFPPSWLTPEVDARAEALDTENQQRAREIAAKVLAKYPAAVLRANLKRIYLLKRIFYSGISAGGTNSRDTVYGIVKKQTPDSKLEEIIHAEFSSILLRNFPTYLDETVWQESNSPDFRYRGNGVQAIRNQQASEQPNDALLEQGFLNEYAKASIEEDFNSFAGRLFVGEARLWKAIENYPRVKAKADMVIGFYQKIDPLLTKEFFNSLRQSTAAASATKSATAKN
jgi:hypothetical protein